MSFFNTFRTQNLNKSPDNDRMDNIAINNEPEDASSTSSNAGLGDRSVHENSPDSTASSTEDIWQQQQDDNRVEIASISDFITSAENDLVQIGLALGERSSTHRVRAAHNFRRADNIEPIDIIDLTNFDVYSRSRSARIRSPDAIIDLCSPRTSRRARRQTTSARANLRRRDDSVHTPRSAKRARSAELDDSTDAVYVCPVCLEDVRTRHPCTTACGHVFCKNCIDSAVRSIKKCPLCNKKMTARNIIRIYL